MIIECTKKLADALKIKPDVYDNTNSEPFYEWHANIFMFNRRKGILLMNNKTRYCIVLYGVKAEHFKKIGKIAMDAIRETLIEEGFKNDVVNKYISNCGSVTYTKTHDRSILGQMKDFYISISWQIEDYIIDETLNLVELNKWVGHSFMCGTLGYAYPIDLLKKEMSEMVC